MKKAIVLLSGGMDSAVTLYMARETHECHALIFDYGQKAAKEVLFAQKIAEEAGCAYYMMNISLPWQGSSLLDDERKVSMRPAAGDGKIPDTYVPARNMLFLGYGVSYAEAIGAEAVFIGAQQLDFSGYPDCRDDFFSAFQKAVLLGTKKGRKEGGIRIITPIINKTKKEIVQEGRRLNVPLEHTWSCYLGGESPCGECESCRLRIKAFEEAV